MPSYDRLTRIDDSMRADHHRLSPTHQCYFYGEYTARKGFSHSDTNQLICNLKKPVSKKGQPDYLYKQQAISKVAYLMNATLRANIQDATFIPVPPSKHNNHPDYDDRLIQVLHGFRNLNSSVEYRQLIYQDRSIRATHNSDNRVTVEELEKIYKFDEKLVNGLRRFVVIFDDMITTGSHFVAIKNCLEKRFSNKTIVGLFIARRVPEAIDPSEEFRVFL